MSLPQDISSREPEPGMGPCVALTQTSRAVVSPAPSQVALPAVEGQPSMLAGSFLYLITLIINITLLEDSEGYCVRLTLLPSQNFSSLPPKSDKEDMKTG